MPTPPPEPSLEALLDELARLAAEVWFEGKLEQLQESEEKADGENED
jgi:hypothetical protein